MSPIDAYICAYVRLSRLHEYMNDHSIIDHTVGIRQSMAGFTKIKVVVPHVGVVQRFSLNPEAFNVIA